MPNGSQEQKKGVVAEITENLGTLFRHLFPGVLVIAVARLAHRSWFVGFDGTSWASLAMVGVFAIAVGNAWFSVNRYVIHQMVDYLCWLAKSQGPAKGGEGGYLDHLSKYVRESLVREVPTRARQHVVFRASSVLLIYTIAELAILAGFWSESGTVASGCKMRSVLVVGGVLLLAAGVWQNIITRRIDAAVLHEGLV